MVELNQRTLSRPPNKNSTVTTDAPEQSGMGSKVISGICFLQILPLLSLSETPSSQSLTSESIQAWRVRKRLLRKGWDLEKEGRFGQYSRQEEEKQAKEKSKKFPQGEESQVSDLISRKANSRASTGSSLFLLPVISAAPLCRSQLLNMWDLKGRGSKKKLWFDRGSLSLEEKSRLLSFFSPPLSPSSQMHGILGYLGRVSCWHPLLHPPESPLAGK